MTSAHLIAIAIRSKSRAPMELLTEAIISSSEGVQGDFRGDPGARQITVLSSEDWARACESLGERIPWTTRRANLFVQGLKLKDTTDSIIRIGEAMLQITGETAPCHRMDEAAPGLWEALTPDWRGGVCCHVIHGGTISTGDPIALETQDK